MLMAGPRVMTAITARFTAVKNICSTEDIKRTHRRKRKREGKGKGKGKGKRKMKMKMRSDSVCEIDIDIQCEVRFDI